VENVDSGLSFPSSSRSRRSATKTPLSRRSKTPVRRSREPSVSRTVRLPSIVLEKPPSYPPSNQNPASDEAQSPKRRRLERSFSSRPSSSQEVGGEIPPGKVTSAVFPIREDAQNLHLHSTAADGGAEDVLSREMSAPVRREEEAEKENIAPQLVGVTKTGRKKRTSVGQQSMQKRKRLSAVPQDNSFDHMIGQDREGSPDESGRQSPATPDREHQAELADPLIEPQNNHQSAAPPKKRKKRKSVVLGRKKKRSSMQSEVAAAPSLPVARMDRSVGETPPRSRQGSSYSSEDTPTAVDRQGQRTSDLQNTNVTERFRSPPNGGPRLRDLFQEQPHMGREEVEGEDDDDGSYVDDQEPSPEPPTPAPPRRTRKQRGRLHTGPTESRGGSVRIPTRKAARSTFPIQMHRMANIAALPTVEEVEDDEQLDGEMNSASGSFIDRPTPNGVDVLAQICRETIETAIERVVQEAPTADRATLKRKRAALEAFGIQLDAQLFDMSAAVENRLNLENRVRRSKREKAALQAEWMEIRRQREQIALKCDRVRERHWECEDERKRRWLVSEAAQRADLALERDDQAGAEGTEEGLEFLLRSVAGHLSSASEDGGLLERIKSFNAELEKLAAILEGRDV